MLLPGVFSGFYQQHLLLWNGLSYFVEEVLWPLISVLLIGGLLMNKMKTARSLIFILVLFYVVPCMVGGWRLEGLSWTYKMEPELMYKPDMK
jgi:ammonia channel protein AmtB